MRYSDVHGALQAFGDYVEPSDTEEEEEAPPEDDDVIEINSD